MLGMALPGSPDEVVGHQPTKRHNASPHFGVKLLAGLEGLPGSQTIPRLPLRVSGRKIRS